VSFRRRNIVRSLPLRTASARKCTAPLRVTEVRAIFLLGNDFDDQVRSFGGAMAAIARYAMICLSLTEPSTVCVANVAVETPGEDLPRVCHARVGHCDLHVCCVVSSSLALFASCRADRCRNSYQVSTVRAISRVEGCDVATLIFDWCWTCVFETVYDVCGSGFGCATWSVRCSTVDVDCAYLQ